MWLLPLFAPVGSFAVRTFYRTTIAGPPIPRSGPLLLVGNHPNSLLDPLFVAAAARRPVRFLAKAPLFSNPWTSWAVRAAGAIPVYRQSDDPALVPRNESMFRAAHNALHAGAAVGIFPEGMSHDAPSLVPLRTGAARIALGARAQLGRAVPIIPVGLVFRDKELFRSDAHVLIGEEISWDGLEGGEENAAAVRELTARIDAALRAVTLNLKSWEDAQLVAAAEGIYMAESEAPVGTDEPVARWRESARILAAARRAGDEDARVLARDVRNHARSLAILGLDPEELHERTDVQIARRWVGRKLARLAPLTFAVAALGTVIFWPPYRLTGVLVGRTGPDGSARASAKLVLGAILFKLWIAMLALLAWMALGWPVGLAALLLLPLLALWTLLTLEQSRETWRDARRFLLLRARSRSLDDLRSRQREIAHRLGRLRERFRAAPA